ncbi:uncharacterized protein LOC120341023 [Styela clava]
MDLYGNENSQSFSSCRRFWGILFLCCAVIVVIISSPIDRYYKIKPIFRKEKYLSIRERSANSVFKEANLHEIDISGLNYLKPTCENILSNLTDGRWIRKADLPISDNSSSGYYNPIGKKIGDRIQQYRKEKGIQSKMWRDDESCGFRRLQTKLENSSWPYVGSWCNANSDKSCCSDYDSGKCVAGSCRCTRCVDMRQILHAEVSEWIPSDIRCKPQNYSAKAACEVIQKANLTELYFVGDSFARKMFRAFILTITDDRWKGAFTKNMTKEMKQLCIGYDQFYWPECRFKGTSLDDIENTNLLCGGKGDAPFNAYTFNYYKVNRLQKLLALVNKLQNKPGTAILLSVGLHMDCNFNHVKRKFLQHVVNAVRNISSTSQTKSEQGRKIFRPKLIILPPVSAGLLKPPIYLKQQGNEICDKYAFELVRTICQKI